PDPRDREPGHRPSARPRPRARFHDRVRGRAMKSATEDARRAMKRRSVIRTFTGLRVRVTLLLVAGMAFQAVGFQALITTLKRRWMLQELESRNRGLATQLAERTELPLVVGDSLLLADEVR